MRIPVAKILITCSLAFLATSAWAVDYFDGKRPLLCSIYQLFECDPPNACQAVTPADINGVSHLDVDFGKKLITRAGTDSPQQSKIRDVETGVDGKLIIQGVEDGQEGVRDGAGWSISIMSPEGTMVMAVAGDGFAVVGLGACVPKP
ncbi:MAG: hypothetical protein QNJ87_15360 [Gammaproteobacteria bacterium]|nr:hypothetical protein [Gammaproteobacteria bacterium]MDJ0873130.1 hypothetical protein [Gammaproteobacteria bacterium]MDJ0891860.1 hypothetical protein [Gammaproteobacteria bacterium]